MYGFWLFVLMKGRVLVCWWVVVVVWRVFVWVLVCSCLRFLKVIMVSVLFCVCVWFGRRNWVIFRFVIVLVLL